MHLFESAAFKLTAYYLAIIMSISLLFSIILYTVTSREIHQDLSRPSALRALIRDPVAFRHVQEAQAAEAEGRLIGSLILLNLATLAFGGGAAYFLAHKTLTPIQEAMEAQGRFIGDASHELRTPLTAMQTQTEVALRNPKLSSSEAREMLHSNLEEVARLKLLTDRLLQLSNNNGLELAPVLFDRVAAEAVHRVAGAAHAKHITIKNDITPLTVVGNSDALEDLLTILLDNAIKYSPAGTAVTLHSTKDNHHIYIHVTDQGEGIKAIDLPHIFERFYRADSSRSKQYVEGYGLGLSLAERIAEAHKGAIRVKSKPGEGSTFTVVLLPG